MSSYWKPILLSAWVLLALSFILMKLAQVGLVATWPWWVVLAPVWGPVALFVAYVLVLVVFFSIRELFRFFQRRRSFQRSLRDDD